MKYIVTILILFNSTISWAQTGHDILDACETTFSIVNGEEVKAESDFVKAGNCMGYIRGINDFNTLIKTGGANPFFCNPNTQNQLPVIEAVVEYLKQNAEKLDKPDFGLVLNALMDEYKCG